MFVASEEFLSRNLQESTETLLADGLAARGVEVTVGGHSFTDSWRHADIVHIHHLANGCVRTFLPMKPRIVFTRHATKPIPLHHRIVLAQTYRASAAVINLSNTERELMSRDVPSAKSHVIYNGVSADPFEFGERARPRGAQRWKFLYVGQLIELKRVDLAIRLIKDLVDRGFDAELEIVTHRPTLELELRAIANRLEIRDRVQFVGPHTRLELGERMRGSNFLILPSRTEALPTVITEALLTGLPVLSFNVGGVVEQVPEGTLLPDISDYEGLLRHTISQLKDYENAAQLVRAHGNLVRERFSVARMVDEHIRIYEGVLADGR